MRYENTHHIIHSTVSENESHAGIIGLLSKNCEIIQIQHLIQGRVINIKFQSKHEKTNYNISAVYLETNNKITKAKMESTVSLLRRENEDHPNNLIVGDFNFINHEKDKVKGLNNKDKLACQIWEPFLAEMDMVDPYREQNPKRRIWSFIGSGMASNSRIDRVYVNSINMRNINNIKYIQTTFTGHRILSFVKKSQNEKGRGYYKMNTSILRDTKYRQLVQQTIHELEELQIEDEVEFWDVFLQTIRSKSISYSQVKNNIKRNLKHKIKKEIYEIEENVEEMEKEYISARYSYLKQKLKQIEENEIEGYKIRVKFLASFEKGEPDIAFYSKLEERKIACDTIGQLAETKDGKIYTDNENLMRIATKFYTDLYTPNKVNIKPQDRLLQNVKKKITQ